MLKIKQFLIVLTIILLVNPISFAQVIVAKGTLVDESFIEIENSEELAKIEDDLAGNYVLTDDIDLQDVEWEPIQDEFTGTITGDDYKIKNMPAEYVEDENFGLFTKVEDLNNIDVEIEFGAKEIENSDDLANIKEDLTGDYILTKDIDLKDAEWEPIEKDKFTGTITGNDFIIENMPAEYVEDENFGLFTEVEDLDNIVVEIEFTEEKTEEPQAEKEAVEGKIEEPQAEEEAVEEETEEPQADKEDSKDEKNKLTQNRAVVSKDVYNHDQLKTVLENEPNITTINLKANISEHSGRLTYSKRIDIAPREVGINGFNPDGENFKLEQTIGGSYPNRAMFRADLKTGKKTQITFKNINLVSLTGNSIITQIGDAVDWTVIFEDVNKGKHIASKDRLINAENAHVKFKGTVNFVTEGSKKDPIIEGAKSVTVESGAKANFVTADYFYTTKNDKAELKVEKKAILDIEAQGENKTLIEMSGDNSAINITDGTFNVTSQRIYDSLSSSNNRVSGLIKLTGANAEFNATEGAKSKIVHDQGSILFMDSEFGLLNIKDPTTEVEFIVGGSNKDSRYDAAIHFNKKNNYHLKLDEEAELKVRKQGGKASAIVFGEGTGNKISVEIGSVLDVHNVGNGQPTNPSGDTAQNQAIQFNSVFPQFILSGIDTEVSLIADNGVAMHMANGGKINVGKGTTFIAHGKTASAANGIIDTGGSDDKGSEIIMEKPKFYDFKNNNNKGFIFHVGKDSTMEGINTEISAWEKGINLEGPSTWSLPSINYKFNKLDLVNLVTGPPELETLTEKHPEGLKAYARLSGDNSGKLAFVSAPTKLNFKVKVKSYTDEYLVDTEDLGKSLIISDDRMVKANWNLKAKMDDEIEDGKDGQLTDVGNPSNRLEDALIYRDGDIVKRLTSNDVIIKEQKYKSPDATTQKWNLSSGWGQGENGLFIEIKPGTLKAEYQGRVKWTLEDAL